MEGGMKLEASIGIPIPRLAYIPGRECTWYRGSASRIRRSRKGAKGASKSTRGATMKEFKV